MTIDLNLITAGLHGLGDAREVNASVTLSFAEMEQMSDEILEARLSRVLGEGLGREMQALVFRQEIVEQDKTTEAQEPPATEFTARTVVMNPKHYFTLCKLLRLLLRETRHVDDGLDIRG